MSILDRTIAKVEKMTETVTIKRDSMLKLLKSVKRLSAKVERLEKELVTRDFNFLAAKRKAKYEDK